MRLPAFICLSVCLLARLLKNACMDLDEMLRVDRCRDMANWLTFEPDPDYSPDAGTGLLSPLSYISHATRNFTSGKSDVYVLVAAARRSFKLVLRPTAAATSGFTMVSFTEAVSRRNTFVGGTCAPPSTLLVGNVYIFSFIRQMTAKKSLKIKKRKTRNNNINTPSVNYGQAKCTFSTNIFTSDIELTLS